MNDVTKPTRAKLRSLVCMPWCAWAIAFAAALFAIGCTVEQEYRVLRFFFDGVPVPEELADKYTSDADAELAARIGAVAAPKREQVHYFYHTPYAQRNCFACHQSSEGYATANVAKDLCKSCHEDYFSPDADDWMHGPVAMSQCSRCHHPHRSEYEGILNAAQPSLCFDCHEKRFFENDPFHSKIGDTTCTTCHDPHASGNRLLLADARTYERRGRNRIPVSEHTAWTKEDCTLCHRADQSNRLVDNVGQVCMTCHRDQVDVPESMHLHKAVAQGECTQCHTAHRSPRLALIRPRAEQICVSCHKIEDLKKLESHPNVTRVDCLICHSGHTSEREHLLRDNVGVTGQQARVHVDLEAMP